MLPWHGTPCGHSISQPTLTWSTVQWRHLSIYLELCPACGVGISALSHICSGSLIHEIHFSLPSTLEEFLHRYCCVIAASLLHQRCLIVASSLHRCHIFSVVLLHHCCIIAASFLYLLCSIAASFLQHCSIVSARVYHFHNVATK